MAIKSTYLTYKDFPLFYEDLVKQFPQNELHTFNRFLELLELPSYKLVAFKDGDKTVGYSLWYIDKDLKFLWLDYFAIFEEFHSHGYGSKILQDFFEENSEYNWSFFEVEKPKCEKSVRRHKFYERLGCKNTGVKYLYPSPQGKFEMDLLYYPINSKISLGNDEVFEIISKVHKDIHRIEK